MSTVTPNFVAILMIVSGLWSLFNAFLSNFKFWYNVLLFKVIPIFLSILLISAGAFILFGLKPF